MFRRQAADYSYFMSGKPLALGMVALVLLGGFGFAVSRWMAQPDPVVEAAPVVPRVLVAKKDVTVGAFVNTRDDFDWAVWSESSIREGYLKEGSTDVSSFDRSVARRNIKADEPILDGMLMKPGSGGFMAAVLEAGKRAVSIPVSATSGNAGFIFPGDRVDLILTHRVKVLETGATSQDEYVISETFMENVRVIAVDQMLDNPENKAILAKTVTVEVTPHQSEMVSVAQEMGKISLSLRSLGNTPPTNNEALTPSSVVDDINGYTSDRDISRMRDRGNNVTPQIRVMRGEKSERVEFYQEHQ